jgi:hypothetical protein
MDFNPAPLPKILSLAAPYISAPFFLLFVFFFFSWLSCFDMSSLDAFETHTNNNDSVSVEKMVLPIETDDVITIRDVSKLYEDISSLYLNKKFPMSSWFSMVKSCTPTRYDLLLFTWIYIAIICSVEISKAILSARSEYLDALINEGSQELQQVLSAFSKL